MPITGKNLKKLLKLSEDIARKNAEEVHGLIDKPSKIIENYPKLFKPTRKLDLYGKDFVLVDKNLPILHPTASRALDPLGLSKLKKTQQPSIGDDVAEMFSKKSDDAYSATPKIPQSTFDDIAARVPKQIKADAPSLAETISEMSNINFPSQIPGKLKTIAPIAGVLGLAKLNSMYNPPESENIQAPLTPEQLQQASVSTEPEIINNPVNASQTSKVNTLKQLAQKPTLAQSEPTQVSQPSSSRDLEMEQAQQMANENLRSTQLGESFGKLAQTIANAGRLQPHQTSFDDSAWKSRQEQANRPIEQLLVGRKAQEQKSELDLLAQMNDINSPISKLYRHTIKTVDPSAEVENLTAAQLQKTFPAINQAISTKEAQKLRLLQTEALKQSKSQQLDSKKEVLAQSFRKEMTQGKLGSLYENALKAQNNLTTLESAVNNPTGYRDLAGTYSYLKSLDENSAVKEGELALGLKLGSIPQRFRAKFKSFLTGEMLDSKQRQEMYDVIKEQATKSISNWQNSVEPIRKQAKKLNIPIEYLPEIDNIQEEPTQEEIDYYAPHFGGNKNATKQYLMKQLNGQSNEEN